MAGSRELRYRFREKMPVGGRERVRMECIRERGLRKWVTCRMQRAKQREE